MKLTTDYFYGAARENGISLKEYFENLDYNYVIIEDGTPIVWKSNNCPVIYGSREDAKQEIADWGGDVKNVSIITEKEFIGRYCFDEYTKALADIVRMDKLDPYERCYELYKREGGDATFEQFKKAVDFNCIDLSDFDEDNSDCLIAEVSSAFADMFIQHDKSFFDWMEALDEDDRFDAYGEILEMTPTMVLNYCDNHNAEDYYEKVNAIRAKYTKYVEIMDTLNGHDAELVKQINDAWNKHRESFKLILIALYERDIDEITDHDAFQYDKWHKTYEYTKGLENDDWEDYNNMVLDRMKMEWVEYADNYLEHIADDADLQCILNFMHYPYLPIWK